MGVLTKNFHHFCNPKVQAPRRWRQLQSDARALNPTWSGVGFGSLASNHHKIRIGGLQAEPTGLYQSHPPCPRVRENPNQAGEMVPLNADNRWPLPPLYQSGRQDSGCQNTEQRMNWCVPDLKFLHLAENIQWQIQDFGQGGPAEF